MAKQEKEQVVFELAIEPKDAFSELEKFKKAILDTKKEQTQLNDALKKGQITQDEYVKESVRLEAMLKRQQSSYNNVQKSVTGVKTQLDKLIDSNKKISKSFQEAASNINVAGVNVGSLTTRLASFANPATAAIGLAGALGTAYAKSTIGAKDLEFAHNQLSAATELLSNSFAGLISSAEDGEGFFSTLLNEVLTRYAPGISGVSKLIALTKEKIQDLGRDEIQIRADVSDRLSENQEKLTQIADEQTKLNDKIRLSDEIVNNLKTNQTALVGVLKQQLKQLELLLSFDKENEDLQTAVLNKKREINKLDADTEKRIQGQVRATQRLIEEQNKILSKTERDRNRRTVTFNDDLTGTTSKGEVSGATGRESSFQSTIKENELAILDSKVALNQALEKLSNDRKKFEAKNAQEEVKIQQTADDLKLQSAQMLATGMAGILQEGTDLQRFFALIGIGIDTAQAISSLTAASEANPANAVTFGGAGAIQFAMGLVRILGNIALAYNYLGGNRAAGGGDFLTNGPTMLMVGDNPGGVERVTVEPISGKGKTVVNPNSNLIKMAGGGSLTSFNDGGMFVNSSTMETNQSLMMSNMMKKQPRPEVSVKEVTKTQNRMKVRVREKSSRSV